MNSNDILINVTGNNKILTCDNLIRYILSKVNNLNSKSTIINQENSSETKNNNKSLNNPVLGRKIDNLLKEYIISLCPGTNKYSCIFNCLITDFHLKTSDEQNVYLKFINKYSNINDLGDFLFINIFILDLDNDELIKPTKFIKWRKSVFVTKKTDKNNNSSKEILNENRK
jgi:hypothetical protein